MTQHGIFFTLPPIILAPKNENCVCESPLDRNLYPQNKRVSKHLHKETYIIGAFHKTLSMVHNKI
jgi:hypothetical protein